MTGGALRRTLVISDLHLGNGGLYDTYAGGAALPALLDAVAGGEPLRAIVNGDGLDFLMNDDPLEHDAARATEQARKIAAWPESRAVLRALGRVLARGGEVTLRPGNHDPELALPGVQSVLREALGQPPEVAALLGFACESEPAILECGGARILVTHGEHDDAFNRYDHEAILAGEPHVYSPGSKLVKKVLNRIMRDYRLLWVNYLKPDFEGAVLCGLGVEPRCLDVALEEGSLGTLRALLKNVRQTKASAQADEEELSARERLECEEEAESEAEEGRDSEPVRAGEAARGAAEPAAGEAETSVRERLAEADLQPDEIKALLAHRLRGPGSSPEDPALRRAQIKLGRASARLLGALHRRIAGAETAAYFALEPARDEWKEVRRLSRKHGAQAVLLGHTHAARFKAHPEVVYANTGTWTWLMALPEPDRSDDEWFAFMVELSENRELSPWKQVRARMIRRLTAALIEPRERSGALVSMLEYDSTGLRTLTSAEVPPAG